MVKVALQLIYLEAFWSHILAQIKILLYVTMYSVSCRLFLTVLRQLKKCCKPFFSIGLWFVNILCTPMQIEQLDSSSINLAHGAKKKKEKSWFTAAFCCYIIHKISVQYSYRKGLKLILKSHMFLVSC